MPDFNSSEVDVMQLAGRSVSETGPDSLLNPGEILMINGSNWCGPANAELH